MSKLIIPQEFIHKTCSIGNVVGLIHTMNHSWPEPIVALIHLEGIIGSSRGGFNSDGKPMIVIVSSFWRETTKEIQSTHGHVAFDFQKKMASIDLREKQ